MVYQLKIDFKKFYLLAGFFIIGCFGTVHAAEFTAVLDREEVSLDESVSLKLRVEADGSVPVDGPQFSAPQFDTINEYQSQQIESYYENGKVGARFTKVFTFVLRPKSAGRQTISEISIQVEGKKVEASPLSIQVLTAPQNLGGAPASGAGSNGAGLRGAGKTPRGSPVFVRAEVDKNKVYKGEQLVVSYYLYSRASQFNANADKFPTLSGFLKEELEMPIVQGKVRDDSVTLEGQVYKRVLLARFAAWPLKEGKLTVDPFGVKVTYLDQKRRMGGDDLEDAEDLFQQFFNQVSPQNANLRSEPIMVEVLPLPLGAPADFSGAVGDFTLTSSVDRSEVKTDETIHFTLKIEGQGNLSTLDIPKLTLPQGVEVFESKAQTKLTSGVKIYDYLLIPRKAGEITLPPTEISFFDPKRGSYIKKSTEAIRLQVTPGDGAPISETPAAGASTTPGSGTSGVQSKTILELQTALNQIHPKVGFSEIRIVVIVLFILSVLALLWKAFGDRIRKNLSGIRLKTKSPNRDREWETLKDSLLNPKVRPSYLEVVNGYEKISSRIYDTLEEHYRVGVRALSRPELRVLLVEDRKMPEDLWNRIQSLLEFEETVRFASHAGAVSEERVRAELKRWVEEAQALMSEILKVRDGIETISQPGT
jgi:hypothetical protein